MSTSARRKLALRHVAEGGDFFAELGRGGARRVVDVESDADDDAAAVARGGFDEDAADLSASHVDVVGPFDFGHQIAVERFDRATDCEAGGERN